MKKATSRLVISAAVMLGITTTQLDVRALAQEPRKDDAAVTAAPPQREATPLKLSVKIPATLNPIVRPAIRWSDPQSAPATPQAKGGSKKKWILLSVAVAGGVGAALIMTQQKETPTTPTPSITVGPPTIGP
jgi:hypothetical protein